MIAGAPAVRLGDEGQFVQPVVEPGHGVRPVLRYGDGDQVLVEPAGQGAGERGRTAGRVALPGQEAFDGGRVGLTRRAGVGGERRHEDRQPAGEPQHFPYDGLGHHPAFVQELARLLLRERPQRHVGDQLAPVAPVRGIEAALAYQGQDEVGGQFAVPAGGQQVGQPPVQLGCGALVGVQEQGDPRHGVRDPVELGDEHGGEDLDRLSQQPGLLQLPGPPAEHRPQPARAPRHDRRVDASGQRPDDRYRPGGEQPGLRCGERPRRRPRALVVRREAGPPPRAAPAGGW